MLIQGEYTIGTFRKIDGVLHVAVSSRNGYTRLIPYLQDFTKLSLEIEKQRQEIKYLNQQLEQMQEFLSEYLAYSKADDYTCANG